MKSFFSFFKLQRLQHAFNLKENSHSEKDVKKRKREEELESPNKKLKTEEYTQNTLISTNTL
jgi:hypothetical protein